MGTLYLLLIIAALFAPTALRPATGRVRMVYALALIAGYAAGIVAHHAMNADANALARFGQDTLPVRFELWRQALQISLQHPIGGLGVGHFGAGQFWAAQGHYVEPANNCHNLLLQLAVEFGWPIAITVAALALWWFLSEFRPRLAKPHTALALGIMLLVGIHSLLEYPLWHLYFAIPAALMFAIGEPEHGLFTKVDARRVLAVAGVCALGMVFAFRVDYDAVAAAGAPILLDARHVRAKTVEDSFGILVVADSRLFRPEVERLLIELKHPPDENTDGPLRRTERVLQMLPAPEVMQQRIVMLAKVGRIDEAVQVARRLPVFAGPNYPIDRDWILDQTRDLGPETAPLRRALREAH
jgi:hypothetical protein